MRRASRSIGVATALALVASSALALGFGRLHNATVLGAPLDFSVPLRFEAGEFVSAECVTVDVLSGDNKLAPGSLRVSLDASGNPEAPLLHLRSSSLIDEPIVTINVGVGCPVRLTRTFVALIDPPLVNLAQAQPSSTPSAAPASAEAPSAPPGDIVAESPPPRRAAPSATSSRRSVRIWSGRNTRSAYRCPPRSRRQTVVSKPPVARSARAKSWRSSTAVSGA
jgi:Tfp pilus assembly protein FimV